MPQSILDSVKKGVNLPLDISDFDIDVIMHINTTFFKLQQLGVGPDAGFMIEDSTPTWEDYVPADSPNIMAVRSYMVISVRLLFDPPTLSSVLDAMQKQAAELEWRLNVAADKTSPTLTPAGDDTVWVITDGDSFPPEAKVGDIGFDPTTGNLWRKV